MVRESRIIRDVLCIIAAVFVLALAHNPAVARIHGGIASGGAVSCPQGGGANDNGCAASPGGSFQVANFFTGYTGTSYSGRPAFNVPGVDYAVGVPSTASGAICGMNALQDPATATTGGNDNPGCGILPAHCSYGTTVVSSQLTVPQITCSGASSQIVLKGFELGPVGGHDATYWFFDSNNSGGAIVEYNDMTAGPSVYYQNAYGVVIAGNTSAYSFLSNNYYGKWPTNFSGLGTGTGSISGTTLTISACTACNFAVGQYINQDNNTAIAAQLTGTTGGVGTYTVCSTTSPPCAAPGNLGSQAITSQFQMAGGANINTNGAITYKYNAMVGNNGRMGTDQVRAASNTATTAGDDTFEYNYVEGGIWTFGIAHFEIIEYVLGDGNSPLTVTNQNQIGNTMYYPSTTASDSVTATFFVSTGAVPAPIGGSFLVTYTNVNIENNVVVDAANNNSSLLAQWGGELLTNMTMTGNWMQKASAEPYNSCNGNPNVAGGGSGPVSFFHGTGISSTETDVDTFQGGTAIIFNGTNTIGETNLTITGQISGTPGGAGNYSGTGGIVLSARNMRSAYNSITNAPTISGNVDLPTNAPIAGSSIVTRTLGSAPCVYQGQQ